MLHPSVFHSLWRLAASESQWQWLIDSEPLKTSLARVNVLLTLLECLAYMTKVRILRWKDSPVIGSVFEGARGMWAGKGAGMVAVKLIRCALSLDQES